MPWPVLPWPRARKLKVRMGLHTGDPPPAEGNYVGIDVHRAARIAAAAHGGQVIVSARTTPELLVNGPPGRSHAPRPRPPTGSRISPSPSVCSSSVADGLPSQLSAASPAHEDAAVESARLPDYSLAAS